MSQVCTAAILLLVLVLGEHSVHSKHYVNEWAAEIRGGRSVAESVADQHGYVVVDEVRITILF